jgi:hypothetical protein
MQEIGFQLYRDVGDDEMRFQMSTTSRRNVNFTGAFGDVLLGLRSVET